MLLRAAIASALLATPAAADNLLQMPAGSVQVLGSRDAAGSYLVPTGPWADGGFPSFEAEGAISQDVWRIEGFGAGVGVLVAVLTGQLNEAGFEPIFSCTTRICGGFDFRFALEVAPEPDMHVNLADFAFHAARRETEAGPEYVALLISQGGGAGFVQSVYVSPDVVDLAEVTLSSRSPEVAEEGLAPVPTDLSEALLTIGRAPLPGIAFAYGSTDLADPDVPILDELAAFLVENPEIRLTLVGHTDAEGGLSANINVSRARANTVRRTLIDRFGIAAGRLSAEGVGYLMPLAPNTTQEGRDVNRRVEAVVINTQ